jgi:hypothetical protein
MFRSVSSNFDGTWKESRGCSSNQYISTSTQIGLSGEALHTPLSVTLPFLDRFLSSLLSSGLHVHAYTSIQFVDVEYMDLEASAFKPPAPPALVRLFRFTSPYILMMSL